MELSNYLNDQHVLLGAIYKKSRLSFLIDQKEIPVDWLINNLQCNYCKQVRADTFRVGDGIMVKRKPNITSTAIY